MKKNVVHILLVVYLFTIGIGIHAQSVSRQQARNSVTIDLSGDWLVQLDSLDEGEVEKWYNKKLTRKLRLPGSLTSNGIGDNISVNTPWTGSIFEVSRR